MSTKRFTEEEQLLLSQNPNVVSITSSLIKFTPEFKQHAYKEYSQGRTMKSILKEAGIEPEILGATRIYGFTENLKRTYKTNPDFIDQRVNNGRKEDPSTIATLTEEVRRLKEELAYTRQEVEFLKKLQQADLEAKRLWDSGSHQG